MSTETMFVIIIGISISVVVILWVEGIDYMKRNHPDYKGEDLFDEEEEDEDQ